MTPLEYLYTVKMPVLSIALMCISAAIAMLLPVALFIYFNRKLGARFIPLLAGTGTFIVFALLLEPLFLSFMPLESLTGVYPIPSANITAYTAIVCLASGLFEETGRFIAIKWVLGKNNGGLDTPLAYGVGHGGIESFLLAGLPMTTMIASSIYLNDGTLRRILAQISEEEANDQAVALLELVQENSVMFLTGGVERLAAITFHICASVLVWMAVKNKIWLYPAAILIHATFNIPAALYQFGVVENVWLVEGVVVVCAALFTAAIVLMLRRSNSSLPE